MNLINFRGLNCYSNCLISIADSWGVRYSDAFFSLWPERDFGFAPIHKTYLTKRLITNLEALGVSQYVYSSAEIKEAVRLLEPLPEGTFLIVGMDAFHIPASPVYQTLHDMHYFFAQKEKQGTFFCFDPTYQSQGTRTTAAEIAARAFELYWVFQAEPTPLHPESLSSAREILQYHPQILAELLPQVQACVQQKDETAYLLGKRMDTLVNNRFLFRHYLEEAGFARQAERFGESFFSRWEAVRNGLFKASLFPENGKAIQDVCALLSGLFEEELGIAQKMIQEEGIH